MVEILGGAVLAEGHPTRFYIWRSAENSHWYWLLADADGTSIAIGGQGYDTELECLQAVAVIKMRAAGAPIVRPD